MPTKKTAPIQLMSFLLDRTGSMSVIKAATIEGFNDYVSKSPQGKDKFYSLTQFDSVGIDLVHDFVNYKDAKTLTDETYQPRANTPLYDAIAHVIAWTEKRAKELSPRKKPAVLVTILTDGFENASKEHTLDSVNALMKKKEEEDGWTFIYIGAAKEAWNATVMQGTGSVQNVYRASGEAGNRTMYMAASVSRENWSNTVPVAGNVTRTVVTEEQKTAVEEANE